MVIFFYSPVTCREKHRRPALTPRLGHCPLTFFRLSCFFRSVSASSTIGIFQGGDFALPSLGRTAEVNPASLYVSGFGVCFRFGMRVFRRLLFRVLFSIVLDLPAGPFLRIFLAYFPGYFSIFGFLGPEGMRRS